MWSEDDGDAEETLEDLKEAGAGELQEL